jgi:hypothetical protein
VRYQPQSEDFKQEAFRDDRAVMVVAFNSKGEALYEFREHCEGQFCFWLGRRAFDAKALLENALLWLDRLKAEFLPRSPNSVFPSVNVRSAEKIYPRL